MARTMTLVDPRPMEARRTAPMARDPLTGLLGRVGLLQRLEAILELAAPDGTRTALLAIDLDGFAATNARFGLAAGDELLRRVADRLAGTIRPEDVLARLGGDEFLVVLTGLETGDATTVVDGVGERVLRALRAPFSVTGRLVEARASIGAALASEGADSATDLVGAADLALRRVKAAGGNAFAFPDRACAAVEAPALPAGPADHEALAAELDRILDGRLIRSAFQPIVTIDEEQVVGYEALARGPEGSPLQRPDLLFDAARATGRLVALEWACRRAAIEGALAAGIRPPLAVFINLEPETLGEPIPDDMLALLERARTELDVVLEITERAVTARPAEIVAVADRFRRLGCGIALDDVGADPRSLALMPLLRPDVIKLDLRLVRERPGPDVAAIVHAVNAEAERSGATILAEGIEDDGHRDTGLALGARLAQGYRYGRPTLDLAVVAPAPRLRLVPPPQDDGRRSAHLTPFALVAATQAPRRGTKQLLLAMSRHLEAQVADQGEAAMLLATFQEQRHFTPLTADRYQRLALRAALVGALGAGLSSEPVSGVRGACLRMDEPLAQEWDVVVLAPHFAAGFVARDLGDVDREDGERRFDFCLTYDRDLVVAAAETMIRRVAPARAGDLAAAPLF